MVSKQTVSPQRSTATGQACGFNPFERAVMQGPDYIQAHGKVTVATDTSHPYKHVQQPSFAVSSPTACNSCLIYHSLRPTKVCTSRRQPESTHCCAPLPRPAPMPSAQHIMLLLPPCDARNATHATLLHTISQLYRPIKRTQMQIKRQEQSMPIKSIG